MEAVAAVEQNLRRAMQIYARATAEGVARELPGVSLVSSGLELAVFNSALLTSPVLREEGGLTRRIALARVFFSALAMPWSFWLCEDLLDSLIRRRLRGILAEHSLRVTAEPLGMLAHALQPPRQSLPALHVERVHSAQTRLAFCEITSLVFDLSLPVARQIYDHERVWDESFCGFVAYWQGQPVSTAALVPAAGSVGVYSVGTLAAFRRRGCAEALIRHALRWAQQEWGLEQTVLQSTRAGQRLYEKLGYEPVTRFTIAVTS